MFDFSEKSDEQILIDGMLALRQVREERSEDQNPNEHL